MNISVGIIGLPNVGKSTLFNALLKKQAALAANYPFATIEPNIGIVPVPDERLNKLAKITANEILKQVQDDKSKWPPIKPATVEFVDIAGLVKGASEGAGLGNKFLSHIREVSVIAHIVRVFEDSSIIKEGSIDPRSDYETIQTELILADMQTLENSKLKSSTFAKATADKQKSKNSAIEKLQDAFNKNIPARDVEFTEDEKEFIQTLHLLSAKPEIVVLNVAEDDYSEDRLPTFIQKYSEILGVPQSNIIVISAQVESDIANFPENEQKEYLETLNLKSSGLERLIKKAYERLGLISFLTAGEKEVRAWTIKEGSTAIEAAGVIHTDFIKKFIKAEIVSYGDFVENNGWKGSREKGKARLEGKEYVMKDGDVVEFKIGS